MKTPKTLYLDLHGVLTCFTSGFEKQFGLSLPNGPVDLVAHIPNFNELEMWDAMDHQDFWLSLPELPAARTLARMLRHFCDDHGISLFLTTKPAPGCRMAYSATTIVAERYGFDTDHVIFIDQKGLLGHGRNSVLIDDCFAQIDPFVKRGGIGFLWPSRSNNFAGYSALAREPDRFEFVKADLLSFLMSWALDQPALHLVPSVILESPAPASTTETGLRGALAIERRGIEADNLDIKLDPPPPEVVLEHGNDLYPVVS